MSPPGFAGEILPPVASTTLLSPFSDIFPSILSDFEERGVGGFRWASSFSDKFLILSDFREIEVQGLCAIPSVGAA